MENNLKYYIQYYIGCRCLNTWFPAEHDAYNAGWTLQGFHQSREKPYCLENEFDTTWTDLIKPILRKLSDITFEEQKYIGLDLKSGTMNTESLKWTHVSPFTFIHLEPKVFHYLLKQRFDLFNLIPDELAVDEKELTNKTV